MKNLLLCVLLPSLLALSCGGKDSESENGSSPASNNGPVASENLADVLSNTLCGNIGGCCAAASLPYNEANCEVVLRQIYGAMLVSTANSENYDAETAGACVDQLENDAASCNFAFNSGPCSSLFAGASAQAAAAGAACGQSCMLTPSGTSCWIEGNAPGECYVEDGLYCNAISAVCEALIAMGQPCDSSRACADGWCEAGTCAPRLEAGGLCDFDDLACQDGLLCDFVSQTCTPKAGVGEMCVFDDDCASNNCPETTCVESGVASTEDNQQFLAIACGGQ